MTSSLTRLEEKTEVLRGFLAFPHSLAFFSLLIAVRRKKTSSYSDAIPINRSAICLSFIFVVLFLFWVCRVFVFGVGVFWGQGSFIVYWHGCIFPNLHPPSCLLPTASGLAPFHLTGFLFDLSVLAARVGPALLFF